MNVEAKRAYQREYMKAYRANYPEKCREAVRKAFSKNRAKYRAQGRIWYAEHVAKVPGLRVKLNLKWRAANKEQWNAYQAVYRAVRSGRLIKLPYCQMCLQVGIGHNGIEAHHYHGYDKANRLDVVWLCTPCHSEVEGRMNTWVRK